MTLYSDKFLEDTDPANLRNVILKQGRAIDALSQAVLRLQQLSSIAEEGGDIGTAKFGATLLDSTGVHTNADEVDIKWWLPLNLSDDDVTDIRSLLFDGTEFIYVAGLFERIGGVDASNIARYSILTRSWEEVGGGVNGAVYAMAFDGSDVLHIGGAFTNAGGDLAADKIAKLSGGSWVNVGGSLNGDVLSVVFDNSGVLHVGGVFTNAGGDASADYIAKLSGGSWVNVGGGLNQLVNTIAFNSSNVLHVGGEFTNAGGDASADYIAKLSGGSWVNVGGGVSSYVLSIAFDANDVLHIGGSFTGRVAKLSSGTWKTIGGGVDGFVNTITFDSDNNLLVGGSYSNAGDSVPNTARIAKWDTTAWRALSNAGGLDGYVYAILPLSNGSIVAGGSFNTAGSIQCQSIAMCVMPLSEAVDLIGSLFELYAERTAAAYAPLVHEHDAGDITSGTIATARLGSGTANADKVLKGDSSWDHFKPGVYTPSHTLVQNLAASTVVDCFYFRFGNYVMLFGAADVDPTAAGQCQLGLSLPIASAFTAGGDAKGSGYGGPTEPIRVFADATNDRITLIWTAVQTVNHTITFSLVYEVKS